MISLLKISASWLLTVTIGSLTVPFGVFLYSHISLLSPAFRMQESFELVPIFFVASAICSLPTIFVMIIGAILINKKNKEFKFALKRINLIHFICAVLTILIGWLIIMDFNLTNLHGEDLLNYFLVVSWYAIIAIPCWLLFFRNEISKMRQEAISPHSTTLDEFQ